MTHSWLHIYPLRVRRSPVMVSMVLENGSTDNGQVTRKGPGQMTEHEAANRG